MSSVVPVEVDEYARIATVEDDHWWYCNIRALTRDLLGPWLIDDPRILDAGCGPGGNGSHLTAHGSVVGVDISPLALDYVRTRQPRMIPVRASVEALPFAANTFDVALAVTVLYTVADDAGALHELARVVRPGGAVLLVEPALESLGRAHDATVHGRRRYRRRALVELVEGVGFRVARATYAFSFLAPAAGALSALDRLRDRRHTPAGSDLDKRALDRFFAPLATAERRWLTHHDLPCGTSLVVLATR
ncbi:class I SAM-dependent methyltransferase [Mycolicibacterium sp.]|uniref:class I SAM-dependent methyltransferase n=1 Tax=Mycolicibacterium sp. TaxID=2320850 RepID=UPI001A1A9765|nr:class I SAM-dependent methyltransferase [Mycolicibacterium sp.]MBJ7341131.1 class I SAM-dependent methyltransferase [Mycolicibacterium sp.]